MRCSVALKPSSDTSRQFRPETLPAGLYHSPTAGSATGWVIAAEPAWLDADAHRLIRALGPALWRYVGALDLLYRESLAERAPRWVARWLELGKPEALLQFGQMKRWRQQLPRVLRPDLLITEHGLGLCELDAIPGGVGFTAALNEAYRQSGFDILEPENQTMADAFWQLMVEEAQVNGYQGDTEPTVLVLVSDEAGDYRPEWQWLTGWLQQHRHKPIFTGHPKDLSLIRDRLVWTDPNTGHEQPIDVVYRFYELFDLPNIPNSELIAFAARKRWVTLTPPYKPWLEEKLGLALLHHPLLAGWWRKALGEQAFAILREVVPPTWVMDPTPLPPHATVAGFSLDGAPIQDWLALGEASQRQRQLVLKPSGFSAEAWGSRGVVIGHDVSGEAWAEAIHNALQAYQSGTPWILQPYVKPITHSVNALVDGVPEPRQVRTRICPYYLVNDAMATESAEAQKTLPTWQPAGILATHCPADKKIIHGMGSAMLAPVYAEPAGGIMPPSEPTEPV